MCHYSRDWHEGAWAELGWEEGSGFAKLIGCRGGGKPGTHGPEGGGLPGIERQVEFHSSTQDET